MKKILLFILLSSLAFSQGVPTKMDSIRFAAAASGKLHLAQIDATNYLLAYTTGGNVTFNTFTIDGNYDITDNSEALTQGVGSNPYLLKLAANKMLLTWENGTNVNIKTLTLAKPTAYTFTKIDSVSLYAVTGSYTAIKHLTGNYYCGILRNTPSTQSEVFTFSMDGAYDNITYIDNLVHDTNEGKQPDIAAIDATHFIVTYAGSADDGYAATFSVDASADNITELDEVEFDINTGLWHNLEQMADDTHYLNIYNGFNLNKWAVVLTLDGSYQITWTDSVAMDAAAQGAYASMAKMDDTHYVANGRDASSDQWIQSMNVDGAYAITVNDSLEHDTNATYNEICRVDDTHVFLAYNDIATGNIVLKTYEFTFPSSGWAHTIGGVEAPSKVGGIEDFTKVIGIE